MRHLRSSRRLMPLRSSRRLTPLRSSRRPHNYKRVSIEGPFCWQQLCTHPTQRDRPPPKKILFWKRLAKNTTFSKKLAGTHFAKKTQLSQKIIPIGAMSMYVARGPCAARPLKYTNTFPSHGPPDRHPGFLHRDMLMVAKPAQAHSEMSGSSGKPSRATQSRSNRGSNPSSVHPVGAWIKLK